MQLTILCTCLSLCLTRALQNSRCALTLFAIFQGIMVTFWRYYMLLHVSFWKFSNISNGGISLNWPITDDVTTRNTKQLTFWPTLYTSQTPTWISSKLHGMRKFCRELSAKMFGEEIFRGMSGIGIPSNCPGRKCPRGLSGGRGEVRVKLTRAAVVENNEASAKLTTANGGTFTWAQLDSVANHVTARLIGDWRALTWLATATGWTRRKRSAICSGKLISVHVIRYDVNRRYGI